MARPFSLRIEGRQIILEGELDLATSPRFEASTAALPEEPGDVTLDARDLTFIDSSGIRAIFALARRIRGGRLKVVHAGEQVLRVLDLVHAEAMIELELEQR